uniref:Sperm microtubule inner protein 1 C-terminal domain-containing protein n=1 Tax=Eutreptiella gymnastica TaxID=73025 RepID=A0A7S1I5L3_9EUGL
MPAKDGGRDAIAKHGSCTEAMGLNTTPASIAGWKATILKEEMMRTEWNKRFAQDVGESYEELLEKTKVKNLDILARTADEDAILRDKGRKEFLKARMTRPPQERFRRPMNESQRLGWTLRELPPVATSVVHHGHKPVIENNFYRKAGVFSRDTSMRFEAGMR